MSLQWVTLHPTAPYDFDLTCHAIAAGGGAAALETFEDGAYRRLLVHRDGPLLATVRSQGVVDAPELEVEVWGERLDSETAQWAASRVGWVLGVEVDLSPFYRCLEGDSLFARLLPQVYGLHPSRTASVFEALVLAITGQQVAGVVARIIRAELIRRYGQALAVDGLTLYAFPRPERLLEAGIPGLRHLKLSGRKAEYIRDICAKVMEGSLTLETLAEQDDDAVAKALCSLRGVGQWTAQWVLLRALGRGDAFPAGDLALRRVISRWYLDGRPLDEEGVLKFAERWAPYRALATTYLFAALRLGLLADRRGDEQAV